MSNQESPVPGQAFVKIMQTFEKGTEWAWLTRSMLIVAPLNESPYMLDLRRDPPLRMNLDVWFDHPVVQPKKSVEKEDPSLHSNLLTFLHPGIRRDSIPGNSSEGIASGIVESVITSTTSRPSGPKEPSPGWPAYVPDPRKIKPRSDIE